MKKCSRCKEIKEDNEFTKDNRATSGLYSACKECCRRLYKREYKYSPIVQKRGKVKMLSTSKGRNLIKKSREKWLKNNPEKASAQGKLNTAIINGTIIRRPCEVCGAERTHGHHDDYSKPLEVRWLCAIHHKELHKWITNNLVKK